MFDWANHAHESLPNRCSSCGDDGISHPKAVVGRKSNGGGHHIFLYCLEPRACYTDYLRRGTSS